MNHVDKVERWLADVKALTNDETIDKALQESSGRRRQMTYHYKSKKLGTVTVCDSWYSKMSYVCKNLNGVGHSLARPEWIVFFRSFEKPEYELAIEAISEGWLTYQFTIVPRTRDPKESVDSWH